MQIMINHLTRMQPGTMCTAGIDLATGLHVRPVLGRPLSVDLLSKNGGPFGLGHVVDLGETVFTGRMPEIEDRTFRPENVTVIRHAPASEHYELCKSVAVESLCELFGQELCYTEPETGRSGTAYVEEHGGLASLGCYHAMEPRLEVSGTSLGPRVRLCFCEQQRQFSVAVTDIRLFLDDHVTPDQDAIREMARTIDRWPELLVAIGLSRPHRRSSDQAARHWLQVNNLFPMPE